MACKQGINFQPALLWGVKLFTASDETFHLGRIIPSAAIDQTDHRVGII